MCVVVIATTYTKFCKGINLFIYSFVYLSFLVFNQLFVHLLLYLCIYLLQMTIFFAERAWNYGCFGSVTKVVTSYIKKNEDK